MDILDKARLVRQRRLIGLLIVVVLFLMLRKK
jgi:hypothetical protein